MLPPDDQLLKDRNELYHLLESKNYDVSEATILLCAMYCELSTVLGVSREQVASNAGLAYDAMQEDSSVPTGNTELH